MMKRIFTMIEFLIVIAIIAILISILLPALRKARNNAHELACKSNLKTIGSASAMYSSDYDDWIVYINDRSWSASWKATDFWTGKLSMYGAKHGKNATECLNPARPSVFRCPAYPDWRSQEDASNAGYYLSTSSHYAANVFLCGKTPTAAIQNYAHRNIDLRAPTRVIFAGDSLLTIDSLQGTYSFYYRHGSGDPRPKTSATVNNDYTSMIAGRANTLYADGHIASRSFQPDQNRWHPLANEGFYGDTYTARGSRIQ